MTACVQTQNCVSLQTDTMTGFNPQLTRTQAAARYIIFLLVCCFCCLCGNPVVRNNVFLLSLRPDQQNRQVTTFAFMDPYRGQISWMSIISEISHGWILFRLCSSYTDLGAFRVIFLFPVSEPYGSTYGKYRPSHHAASIPRHCPPDTSFISGS